MKQSSENHISQWLPRFAAQLALWSAMVLIISTIWDLWYLEGPHGPYRWVGMDFAPYWVGVREMLGGGNPYSAETTIKIQQIVYGGPVLEEDPMMFVYPAWLFLLVAPFALLPFKTAVVIISATFLWGLLNLLFLLAQHWSGQKPVLRLGWMLLLVVGSFPFIVISITKGQLGYLALFALFVSRRLWERNPFWAGVFLSLAVIKPTAALLPMLGFLSWALIERNWKYLVAFFASVFILLITSWIAVGNWFQDYLAVLMTTGGMPVQWSLDILSWPLKIIYAGGFIGILIYAFFLSWRRNQREPWCSATILAGLALFPMRWIYDLYLYILIPPEESQFSRTSSIFVGIAVMAPWSLVVFREGLRWSVALIGIPLIWALVFLTIQSQTKA